MAKTKTTFFCQNCGAQYAKWQGQCNSCKEWNTIAEEVIQKAEKVSWKTQDRPGAKQSRTSKPQRISEISTQAEARLNTRNNELNRVLGGGLVPGSLTLLGGEPGIGKSTLMLQIALQLPYRTLYVSGEESAQQIKMRAERIQPISENCFILTETKTQNIFRNIEENEPDIYRAIKPGALLENVGFKNNGNEVDFSDSSITQNTRVSYPIEHITNIQQPSYAGNPRNIFFLTADAFGVLPPVSKLTPGQAAYHFISGYTAKVAGTEAGVNEPIPSFSACFGEPFMPLHPTVYAEMLSKKMTQSKVNVWLINTGWSGGPYGTGSRIKLKYTRAMIAAILEGELENSELKTDPIFGLHMPVSCPNVPDELLDPINTWKRKEDYFQKAIHLANSFHLNFEKFSQEASSEIIEGGPKVDEHHKLKDYF